jgi:Cytochrome c554 and c-prime
VRLSIGSSVVVFSMVVAGFSSVGQAVDRDAANYAGVKSCKMCHSKPDSGDQFGKWQASPHAKAFETLGSADAKAAGAKVGVADPQKSGKCLKCHSTAYNFAEQLSVTDKITPEEGVTCESCHGPGKAYKSKAVMEDHAKCVENGIVSPATKSCELCHNSESPSWKADRYTTKDGKKVGFDAEQAFDKIKHADPKVKK